MPNGDFKFDIHFPEYEEFFAPISNAVESFAGKYN